jgi:hypothetical protein
MQSTRFVQRTHSALFIAVCVGLVSPALTWADGPLDRPLVSNSVPDLRNSDVVKADTQVTLMAESLEELSPEQIQETADQLLAQLGVALQNLVFTMINFDMPMPELHVASIVVPPAGNGGGEPIVDGGGDGVPPTSSPEPGTLVAGLAGAGAFLVRYYRRRRAKVPAIDGREEMRGKEIDLVM